MYGIGESIAFLGLCASASFCLFLGEKEYAFWLFIIVVLWSISSDWGGKTSINKGKDNEKQS